MGCICSRSTSIGNNAGPVERKEVIPRPSFTVIAKETEDVEMLMPAPRSSRIVKNGSDDTSFGIPALPETSKEGSSADRSSFRTQNLSDRHSVHSADLRSVFSEMSLVTSSFSHTSGSLPTHHYSFTDADNDICKDVRRHWQATRGSSRETLYEKSKRQNSRLSDPRESDENSSRNDGSGMRGSDTSRMDGSSATDVLTQRELAAIAIQKNVRGHQARVLSEQRELAATKIQKSVRGHQARRKFKNANLMKKSYASLQDLARCKVERNRSQTLKPKPIFPRILQEGDTMSFDNFSDVLSTKILRSVTQTIQHVDASVSSRLDRNLWKNRSNLPSTKHGKIIDRMVSNVDLATVDSAIDDIKSKNDRRNRVSFNLDAIHEGQEDACGNVPSLHPNHHKCIVDGVECRMQNEQVDLEILLELRRRRLSVIPEVLSSHSNQTETSTREEFARNLSEGIIRAAVKSLLTPGCYI